MADGGEDHRPQSPPHHGCLLEAVCVRTSWQALVFSLVTGTGPTPPAWEASATSGQEVGLPQFGHRLEE